MFLQLGYLQKLPALFSVNTEKLRGVYLNIIFRISKFSKSFSDPIYGKETLDFLYESVLTNFENI